MRKCALALACAVLASCGAVNVVKKQKLELKPVSLPLRTFAFPSGLRVVVERDARTPLAGVFVVVGSGSASDPTGKEGLAHYVEHLAFQSRPFGAENFGQLLDNAGAVQRNAFTDWDSTTYYEIGPASALPQLLRTEAIRMVVPVSDIPDGARALELDVVRNELRERNETGFVGDVLAHLQAQLFPGGHPYARAIGGSQESLSAFAKDDVEAFAKEHYRPENMTLVILGNVELETADKLLAETLPGALVAAPQPVKLSARLSATPPAVPAPAPKEAALPRVQAAIASPELWIGWTLPRGFDRDGYLLSFLTSAARERLWRARTDDRDIANVEVLPVPGKEASMLLCRVELHTAAAPERTLALLLSEADKIVNQFLVNPDDAAVTSAMGSRYTFGEMAYSRARRTILVSEVMRMQDLVDRGLRRAAVTHFAQDPALLSKALHDLAELKSERFHEYAVPYLNAERARATLFLPTAGAAAGGPSEQGRSAAPDRGRTGKLTPPAQALADQLLAGPAQLASYTLKNGMRVVLAQRAGLPLVTASLALGIDAAAARDAGSRAFARAMARPASDVNEPSEYGGLVSERASDDGLADTVEASSGNAEGVIATLAERVRTLKVQAGADVQFKDAVLPNYQRMEREPHRKAARDFLAAVLQGSPYGRVAPYDEIAQASLSGASDWLDKVRTPANATLVVVGDFDAQQMKGFVEDSFGGWSGPSAAAAQKTAVAASSAAAEARVLVTPRPGGSQGEIRFGCRLPDVGSGAMAARHELAARVIGEKLFDLLRERLGAAYGAQARAVELFGGASYLDVRANVENRKLAPALRELKKVLAKMAAEPASDDALRWARYQKASGVALAQMTNAAVAASIASRLERGLSPDLGDVRQELAAVAPADVQADFQACLAASPTLSIVGEEGVVNAALDEGWRRE